MTRAAVLGAGIMGAPIARNLRRAAFDPELARTVMNLFERANALRHGDDDMAVVVRAVDSGR